MPIVPKLNWSAHLLIGLCLGIGIGAGITIALLNRHGGASISSAPKPRTTVMPPLQPHETSISSANGCNFVAPEHRRALLEKSVWTGACVDGFALGEGHLLIDSGVWKHVAWFGRLLYPATTSPDGWSSVSDGMTTANYNSLDEGIIRFAKRLEFESVGSVVSIKLAGAIFSTEVMAISDGCATRIWQAEILKYCVQISSEDAAPPMYGVLAQRPDGHKIFHPCPDPSMPTRCEAVWREHAGPLMAKVRELQTDVQSKTVEALRLGATGRVE